MKKIILLLLLSLSFISFSQGHRRALFLNHKTKPFVITVKSDNIGTSNDDQFTIKTTSGLYDYKVVTSDGYIANGLSGDHTITFPSGAGTHTVEIYGVFPKVYYNFGNDIQKITEINQWGIYGQNTTEQNGAFFNGINILSIPNDIEFLNDVINGGAMFNQCPLTSLPIELTLDNLTNGSSMFSGCNLTSLPPLMTLPNVTSVNFMFSNNNLISLPSGMTLSQLTSTRDMFSFNNLTSLPSGMTLPNVTSGLNMFYGNSLTSLPSGMVLDNLIDGASMFNGQLLTSLPVGMTLPNLVTGTSMFLNSTLASLPTGLLLTNLVNGNFMFNNCDIKSIPNGVVLDNLLNARSMIGANPNLSAVGPNIFSNTLCTNFFQCFSLTNLTQSAIDTILVNIESNGTSNGLFDQSGGSAPSATGEAAIDALRARGWTITVTGGY
jgi:hypothetical protein